VCSVNFQDGILFYFFFDVVKKNIGRVFGVGRWCCPKFLPPIPIAGFLFSGTREANASAQYGPSFSILSHLSPILVIFIVGDLLMVTNLQVSLMVVASVWFG